MTLVKIGVGNRVPEPCPSLFPSTRPSSVPDRNGSPVPERVESFSVPSVDIRLRRRFTGTGGVHN